MSVQDIVNDIEAFDDDFIARLKKSEERLVGALTEATESGELMRAKDVDSAIAETQRIMENSGYYDVVTDRERYQYYLVLSVEMLAVQGVKDVAYTSATYQEIQALAEARYIQSLNVADDVRNTIAQSVMDLRFGAVTRTDMLRELYETGMPRARTMLDTANTGFVNIAHTKLAEDVGINKFRYMGARDKLTRPFCNAHINEVKTREEWEALDNGQGLPVFLYGGGYNCRHRLVAVVDE